MLVEIHAKHEHFSLKLLIKVQQGKLKNRADVVGDYICKLTGYLKWENGIYTSYNSTEKACSHGIKSPGTEVGH